MVVILRRGGEDRKKKVIFTFNGELASKGSAITIGLLSLNYMNMNEEK
jgi:hypothetical protein